MKKLIAIAVLTACMIPVIGCNVQPDNGFEAVLVKKPWLAGHGGIDPTPVPTGLTFVAPTTEAIYVNMQPIQADIILNDIMTSDGVPLGFDAVVRVQVLDSVKLIKDFGAGWYENNVKSQVMQYTRQAVRKHGMNETAIQPTAIEAIDNEVDANMRAYLVKINMPVKLIAFTVGKANPPDAIKNQRIETAAQQQRILTEGQKKLAEDARKNAELSRAEADNAYRNQMGLSPDQFLQLENINMKHDVCLHGAKCTFIDGGKSPLILDGK